MKKLLISIFACCSLYAGAQQAPVADEISVADLTKMGVLPGNYSGICWLGSDQFAIVSDKEIADGFFLLNLQIDSLQGSILKAERGSLRGNVAPRVGADGKSLRDAEDIVWHPSTNTFFICGEGDQQIVEYDTIGQPTGRSLSIPNEFSPSKITGNYGFEALAYNESTGLFWTTTESTLPSDGQNSSYANRGVRNVLRIQSFDESLQPHSQYAYMMDLPTVEHNPRQYAFGVVAMTALDNGLLLVLEREFYVAKSYLGSYVENRLYCVNPSRSTQISSATRLSSLSETDFMAKTLMKAWRTTLNFKSRDLANFEGMCLGPRLADGRQTLILISDSQGGYGNSIFSLHDFIKVMALH